MKLESPVLPINLQGTHPSNEEDSMRRREVGRVPGNGVNALKLHGKRRGAIDLDNRLAYRRKEVQRVDDSMVFLRPSLPIDPGQKQNN